MYGNLNTCGRKTKEYLFTDLSLAIDFQIGVMQRSMAMIKTVMIKAARIRSDKPVLQNKIEEDDTNMIPQTKFFV